MRVPLHGPVAGRAGCAAVAGLPPAPVANEHTMVSLPDYVIEPPDILEIDMLKIVPKSPYKIETLDYLGINVSGTPANQPITGTYSVEPGGTVNLGTGYGRVKVENLTLEEAAEAIYRQLSRVLKEPQVSVTLAQASGQQQVQGEHRVGPDGTINLGIYGTVYVTGLTIEQAKKAIETQLSQYLDAPEVSVDIYNYASKVYYVYTQGAGLGDSLVRSADHRKRHRAGRCLAARQPVAKLQQQAYLDRPARARRNGLRSKAGGRLERDHSRRLDGDELSDSSRRPPVHRPGQSDRLRYIRRKDHRAVRTPLRLHWPGGSVHRNGQASWAQRQQRRSRVPIDCRFGGCGVEWI